jgi:hypothetical protein
MRFVLVAALAAGIPVSAQDAFITGEALAQDIQRCEDGCIVFDRQQAATLEHNVRLLALQAYQAGLARGQEKCSL